VLTSKISSGMPGHRTPTGVFAILQRARYHESNLYSNAPMPFMQRLTWSGVALHAGKLPGYPASHGCIRLPYAVAEQMFGLLRLGARVVVTHDPVTPQAIAHTALPQPRTTHVPSPEAPRVPLTLATTAMMFPQAPVIELAPRAAAEHEKRRVATELAAARDVAKQRLADAAAAADAANAARRDRLAAEAVVGHYQLQAQRFARDVARAASDEDRVQAEASLFAAEEAIADAQAAVATVRANEVALLDASFPAARRAREAEDAVDRAEAAVRLAAVGTEPISIFVSRKEGRLYARQGFTPVFDAAIELTDAGRPLGTHVFQAHADVADPARLTWTAVSTGVGGSAAQALERLRLPASLEDRIAKRLFAGATLIISDTGLGPETGQGTDFVVLTP
jgi:hypothetical protein